MGRLTIGTGQESCESSLGRATMVVKTRRRFGVDSDSVKELAARLREPGCFFEKVSSTEAGKWCKVARERNPSLAGQAFILQRIRRWGGRSMGRARYWTS